MKKLTRSHTTIIDCRAAKLVFKFLGKSADVKSFTAGIIVPKRPPSRTDGPTKIILTQNSLQISINSKRSKQEVWVYGYNLQKVANNLVEELIVNNLSTKLQNTVY